MKNQCVLPGAFVKSLLVLLLMGRCAVALSPCQLPLDGDFNRDCKVNMIDMAWFATLWLEDLSGETGAFLPEGIYVSHSGSDGATCGSMTGPCATVNYGIGRAVSSGKSYVFVADGAYAEIVTVVNGINLWGGFDPLTWVRKDASQANTVLLGGASGSHAKTLVANSVTVATEVSRFQIKGGEAPYSPGNSYTVYIKDSDSDLVIKDNYIWAGKGADGSDGTDGEGGIDGPDGMGGEGAGDSTGSVPYSDWIGVFGTDGEDSTAGGGGGGPGGGAFGIFVLNTVASSNKPSITGNVICGGVGGKGGNGGWGGYGYEMGAGGGGGGGAGGIAFGIYTWNVTGTLNYEIYNTFVGIPVGGSGGKGGNSYGNPGTDAVDGWSGNYTYE